MTPNPPAGTPEPSRSGYPVYRGLRAAGPGWVQWLGFVAAPAVVALLALVGLPLAGILLGVALFAANRVVALLTDRAARGKLEVTAVGITGVGFISRAWVSVALLFVLTRVASEDVALAAALAFLALFTIDILARSLSHLVARGAAPTPSQEIA